MLDIKDKKQFLQISVTAFILSLIPQILSEIMLFIRREGMIDPDMFYRIFIGYVDFWISFTIAPILIFAGFYLIGKKPNLILEMRPILSALVIGNFASSFIGSIIYSAITNHIAIEIVSLFMLQFFLVFVSSGIFAALAGLSMGHVIRKKEPVEDEF